MTEEQRETIRRLREAGIEISDEPPGLDTPLGRWLADPNRPRDFIRYTWAEQGIFPDQTPEAAMRSQSER